MSKAFGATGTKTLLAFKIGTAEEIITIVPHLFMDKYQHHCGAFWCIHSLITNPTQKRTHSISGPIEMRGHATISISLYGVAGG